MEGGVEVEEREGGGRSVEGRWKEETLAPGVIEVTKRVSVSAAALIGFKSTVPVIHISVTGCVGGGWRRLGLRRRAGPTRKHKGLAKHPRRISKGSKGLPEDQLPNLGHQLAEFVSLGSGCRTTPRTGWLAYKGSTTPCIGYPGYE